MRQTKESRTRSDSVGTERALEDFPKSRQGRIRRGRRAPQSTRVQDLQLAHVVAIWRGGRRLNEAALHLAASAASGDNGVVTRTACADVAATPIASTQNQDAARIANPHAGPESVATGLAGTDRADAQSAGAAHARRAWSRAPLTPPCSRIAARCRSRRSICRGGTCPTW